MNKFPSVVQELQVFIAGDIVYLSNDGQHQARLCHAQQTLHGKGEGDEEHAAVTAAALAAAPVAAAAAASAATDATADAIAAAVLLLLLLLLL